MAFPSRRVSSLLTAYPPSTGGAQIHTHRLALALSDLGVGIHVTSFWDTNRSDWLVGTTLRAPSGPGWTVDGIPVQRPRMHILRRLAHIPFLPFHYPFPRFTTPILSRLLQPGLESVIPREVELIHHVRIGREILAHSSLAIARKRGVPFVLTPLHHPRWVGWRYAEWLRIYRQADLLFALTAAEKSTLEHLGVDPRKILVIGHAPCLAEIESPSSSSAPPTILFLGQHYAYKGWRQLHEAAPLVWRTHPHARFVFAGPDVGDSAKAFRETDPRIVRMGKVDESTKVALLRDCTLLALPSTQESFGGVFTEAWHFGKPVIGCPIPAVSELIQDGQNGLLRAQDPMELAQAITWLLDHLEEAVRMGENGRNLVQEKFTWPHIAAKVLEGYAQAIDRIRRERR